MKRTLYTVQVQVVTEKDGWSTSIGCPTFLLSDDVQGIVNEDHAARIARSVVNPFDDPRLTLHVSVAKTDEE